LSKDFRELPRDKISAEERRVYDEVLGGEGDERVPVLRDRMRRIMNEKVWVFRRGDGLEGALKEIRELKKRFKNVRVEDKGKFFNIGLVEALQLDFALDLAEVTTVSALARTESRGAHSRIDYPKRDDDNWLKHTLAHFTSDGPRLSYVPVAITRWPPAKRAY